MYLRGRRGVKWRDRRRKEAEEFKLNPAWEKQTERTEWGQNRPKKTLKEGLNRKWAEIWRILKKNRRIHVRIRNIWREKDEWEGKREENGRWRDFEGRMWRKQHEDESNKENRQRRKIKNKKREVKVEEEERRRKTRWETENRRCRCQARRWKLNNNVGKDNEKHPGDEDVTKWGDEEENKDDRVKTRRRGGEEEMRTLRSDGFLSSLIEKQEKETTEAADEKMRRRLQARKPGEEVKDGGADESEMKNCEGDEMCEGINETGSKKTADFCLRLSAEGPVCLLISWSFRRSDVGKDLNSDRNVTDEAEKEGEEDKTPPNPKPQSPVSCFPSVSSETQVHIWIVCQRLRTLLKNTQKNDLSLFCGWSLVEGRVWHFLETCGVTFWSSIKWNDQTVLRSVCYMKLRVEFRTKTEKQTSDDRNQQLVSSTFLCLCFTCRLSTNDVFNLH